MARVFPKPCYTGELDRPLKAALAGGTNTMRAGARGKSKVIGMIDDEDHGVVLSSEEVENMYSIGEDVGVGRVTAAVVLAAFLKHITGADNVACESEAADELFKAIIKRGLGHRRDVSHGHMTKQAACLALAGCVGGFGGPKGCAIHIEDLSGRVAAATTPDGTLALDWIVFADNLRLGSTTRAASAAYMRASNSVKQNEPVDELDLEAMRNRNNGLTDAAPWARFHSVGRNLVVVVGSKTYVLDNTVRGNLASCIYTYANWCITGAAESSDASRAAIRWVHESLTACPATRSWHLARYAKSCYAVIVAKMQHDPDPELYEIQMKGLIAECEQSRPDSKITPLYVVMDGYTDAANFGTVWNVLLPCSISGDDLVKAFSSKTDKVHESDDDAWEDFMAYALTTISAHYLYKNRTATVTWAKRSLMDAEPRWATACREGSLTYCRDHEVDWIVDSIPWVRTIESWNHSANDVTHVWADGSRTIDNELVYALEHGSKLSGKWTPTEVRDSFYEGNLVGERVLYMAGKSENTKFGAKVRETMSGDDVLREVLSEVDANLTSIGMCVEGVSMRTGRAGVERMVRSVVTHGTAKRLLMSLDVSGWSPNMIRRKELEFIDALLRMYKIPQTASVLAAFGTPVVVFSKCGVEAEFPMVDGSVQGFFGTADTILHSLVAQWAFRNGKAAGIFEKDARMKKCVLIDDILCCLDSVKVSPSDAVSYFTSQYKRLGFSVDVVKTLAAANIGTFLNRIYHPRGEYLTYAKIASRADREWDRPVIGIGDEVDSVFAGYAGAIDRGFPVIAGYYLATLRAVQRLHATMNYKWDVAVGFLSAGWFAPIAMGGFGVPNAADWIAGGGMDGYESKLSTTCTILDAVATRGFSQSDVSRESVRALAESRLASRSNSAIWASPNAVRHAGVPSCARPVRDAILSTIRAKYGNTSTGKLLSLTPDESTEATLGLILENCSYPAPIMAAAWGTTPYAVADGLVARYLSCQSMLSILSRRSLVKVFRGVHRLSRDLIAFSTKRYTDTVYQGEVSAAAIHRHVVNREGRAHAIPDLIIPTTMDYIRQATDGTQGGIEVHIPACADMRAVPMEPIGNRTYVSSRVAVRLPASELGKDPITKAVRDITKVAAIATGAGWDGKFLYAMVMRMWGNLDPACADVAITVSNPYRVLPGMASNTHTVRALPNYAPRIAVNMNRAISAMGNMHKTFDWMTIRTALQAASCIDCAAGLSSGISKAGLGEVMRGYVVQVRRDLARATPSTDNYNGFDISGITILSDYAGVTKAIEAALMGEEFEAGGEDETPEGANKVMETIGEASYRVRIAAPIRRMRANVNLSEFMAMMIADNPVKARDERAGEADVLVTREESDANGIVSRWMAKFRRMAPADFTALVANDGAELKRALDSTATGKSIWKQLASRRVDDCVKTMEVLGTAMTLGRNSNSNFIEAWRLLSAEKHARLEKDLTIPDTDRYYHHYMARICAGTAKFAASTSGHQVLAMVRAAVEATNIAVGRFSGAKSFDDMLSENETEVLNNGRVATLAWTVGVTNRMSRLIVPEDFKQRNELLDGLKRAISKVHGWIVDDSGVSEARTATLVEVAAPISADNDVIPEDFDMDAMFDNVFDAFNSELNAGGDEGDDDVEGGDADV